MAGLSANQFASQAMSSGVNVQATSAVRSPQTAITNAGGQPIQQLSKATLNANYEASHSAFQSRMATANQMSAALTPTKLMQNSGRSASFIASHTGSGAM
jgi:hypothetical protein